MPDHCTQPATANSGASSTLTVPLQTDRFDSDWVHWERVEGYKQFTKVNPPAKDGDDGRRTLGEVALGALRSAARDSHLEFSKDFEKASTGDQEKLAIEFWATQDVRNSAYRHSIMSRNASTAAGRFTLAVDIASDEDSPTLLEKARGKDTEPSENRQDARSLWKQGTQSLREIVPKIFGEHTRVDFDFDPEATEDKFHSRASQPWITQTKASEAPE